MNTLWLADYTWLEIEQLIGQGFETLLLMLGATEQHGPHLPLSTDTLIAQDIALKIAGGLGKTLVAPVIPVGTSDEHLDFAGTLSLSKTTLAGLICDIGKSAARHGFKSIVVLSMHGGNYDAIRSGVAQLQSACTNLKVVAFIDLTEALKITRRKKVKQLPEEIMGLHAGERETSEILQIQPELVRFDLAQPGYVGNMRDILPRLMEAGLRPVTENGVLGDPTYASATNGEVYLEELASALIAAIKLKIGQEVKNVVNSA